MNVKQAIVFLSAICIMFGFVSAPEQDYMPQPGNDGYATPMPYGPSTEMGKVMPMPGEGDYSNVPMPGGYGGDGYGVPMPGGYGGPMEQGGIMTQPRMNMDGLPGGFGQPQGQQMQQGNAFGTQGSGMGMPNTSFADPEYVAQQKMVEGMTTTYNWIALNSARFAEGCKGDRDTLVSEISGIIRQAQETSSVCTRFEQEANSCNPEMFCSQMSAGQFLPPEMRTALKKAGYDPENLGTEGLTQDMIVKACIAQMQPEIDARKQMIENAKQGIASQIPELMRQCGEMKKQKEQGMAMGIKLPQINIQPQMVMQNMQQRVGIDVKQNGGYGCTTEAMPKCREDEHPECWGNVWNCVAPVKNDVIGGDGACPQPPTDCGSDARPYCKNGIWECPQGDQVTDQTETGTATEADETIITTDGTATTDGQTTTDEEETETTSESGGTEQTAADAGTEMPATGLVTTSGEGGGYGGYVCGNGMCEPSMGESYGNCSSDCMQGTDGQQGRGTIVVTSEGGKTNMVSGGQQAQGGQGQYGQQMYAQGPSPEMLCEMSDEDIINQYVTMPMGGGNDEKMLEYKCGQESGRIIDEMNMYALNTARCRAETALDCEAKRQAVKSCNEAKSNPDALAKEIVNSNCRRFGIPITKGAEKTGLYELGNRIIGTDAALGNQFIDTAEKTAEDQQNLGIVSYILGDQQYGGNLNGRVAKLRAIRERMVSGGVNDTETISALDEEINSLETEAGRFNNFLDITRFGYLFGR